MPPIINSFDRESIDDLMNETAFNVREGNIRFAAFGIQTCFEQMLKLLLDRQQVNYTVQSHDISYLMNLLQGAPARQMPQILIDSAEDITEWCLATRYSGSFIVADNLSEIFDELEYFYQLFYNNM